MSNEQDIVVDAQLAFSFWATCANLSLNKCDAFGYASQIAISISFNPYLTSCKTKSAISSS